MKTQWFIATKKRGKDIFDLSGLIRHEPPPGTYQADPCVVEYEGTTYIFHELYDYQRGRIAVSKLEDDKLTEPVIILDRGYHMSFPMVVKIGDAYFMTPETGANNRIEVYVAIEFPYEWQLFSSFDSGYFSDVALLPEKPYSLYTTIGGDKLRIYRSHDLLDWRLTYSADELYSRPAGNFFKYRNEWVRPVQDSMERYGRRVVIRSAAPQGMILKYLEPTWYTGLTGFHTFNMTENTIVVDGRITI